MEHDEPYSPWEHFFFPQLRLPAILLRSDGAPHFGALLGGGDRLGMQRWSLAGYVQPRSEVTNKLHWGGNVAYLNTMLAPWQISTAAGFLNWVDPVKADDSEIMRAEDRRTRDASLSLARTWRGTLKTTLSAVYTEDFDQPPGMPEIRRQLGGPELSLAWTSYETTAYTGIRRGFLADGSVAYYPHALSSFASDIYDISGGLGAIVPLPFGRRHILSAKLRGRALVARDDTNLLQLGGDSGIGELWSRRSTHDDAPDFDTARFPPNLRFIEDLRGYEDYAITTDRAGLAELAWRYPLIIDRGTAATLRVLPALFISELDLELFGAGAIDRRRDLHMATGAAVSLRIFVWQSTLLFVYQIARRVRDDDALTQRLSLKFTL